MAGFNLSDYDDEIVFRMHNNGFFEFAPLRYVQGQVSSMWAFVHDKRIFTLGLDEMLIIRRRFEIDSHRQ